jgi:hypothetical protein
MLRRRDMMGSKGKASGLPLVFPDGRWTIGDKTLIIKDGVVAVRSDTYDAYDIYAYINLSNPDQNTTDSHTTDNVTNKPAIFSIPAGAVCELSMTGIYKTEAGYSYVRASLYEALSTNAVANTSWSPNYHSGDYSVSKTWTQETEVDVGCVAMDLHHVMSDSGNTADANVRNRNAVITLTVNGERWI